MKRLLMGAIGTVATMAMTMAIRRLHHQLPLAERYPKPPWARQTANALDVLR